MNAPIKHFLGPRGVLLGEGMEFRKQQLEMSEAVAESIETRKPLLIEAGTGVGKSLAYLLPAALASHEHNIRVLVSTHTRALQEQLVRKDLPFLSDALSKESISFSFALFMGSENYLCLRRFNQALRDADALFAHPANAEALHRLRSFTDEHPAKAGQSGLRMDLPEVTDEAWRNILRESDNCMSSKSPHFNECYHRAAQAKLKDAGILVVNHALFFTNLAAGGRVLPAYDVAILDEAHSVEEVAATHLGLSLTNFAVKWQLDQIHHPETERGLVLRFPAMGPAWKRTTTELIKKMRVQTDLFFESLITALKSAAGGAVRVRKPRIVPNILSQPIEELADHLREGRDRLESPEDKQEIKAYADRLSGMSGTIETFLSQDDRMLVYWIETQRRARGIRVQIRAAPVDLSRVLQKTLFSEDGPTPILTSATLTVKDDFEFVASRIGAARVNGIVLGSPFDYDSQCLLYLPKTMPDPAEDGAYYRAVEKEVQQLIELSGGGAFVLCTSHDWVNKLFRSLSEKMADFNFFKQGGPRSFGILDEFRKSQKAVLIGTDTFWQGVDVPGDALKLVIVTRLPFAMPDHPLEEAKIEYLREQGFDPFTRHTLPTAVLMLRQGFGRLIRRSDDRGVVAVLDPRIRTRAYGHVFLKSLPPAAQTTSPADVKRFFSATS